MSIPAISQVSRVRRFNSHQRGVSALYLVLILFILIFFVSVGVDMGRVRVARSQLQTAADAAAFAGVRPLPQLDFAGARARAVAVAAQNRADGTAVALDSNSDIQFGLYRQTTNRYTAVGATEPGGHVVVANESNAIKVTPKRMASRGNPVNLTFARIVGRPNFDAWASATAFIRGGQTGYGIVGIDWVTINGTSYTDSYSHEPYDPNNHNANGSVGSNGPINMNGTTDIWGDARPGIGSTVNTVGNAEVHGWSAPLDAPLSFPPATVPNGVPNEGPLKLTGGNTRTLTTGNHWFTSLSMKGNSNLIVSGPTKVYVTGDIDLSGGSVTNPGSPSDLELIKVGPGNVDLGGGGTLRAHVYAPEANVTIHGTGSFGLFGWVIGRTLTINGNSAIHYDETLPMNSQPYRSVLVK